MLVQKWGGGVGYSFGRLRPKGTPISSTHGSACGPVMVLKKLASDSKMITQAGKRSAAQMGVLPVDHPDVREFIHVKDYLASQPQDWNDPDPLTTFNISVSVTDEFMHRVSSGDKEANALFDEIAASAWATGDPGLLFIDAANRSNPLPHQPYEATNPCGEQWLQDNDACNLGSINLTKFVSGGGIDYVELRKTIRMAIEYLDYVIDQNTFPVQEVETTVRSTRRLGLGVMGVADVFMMLGIHYDSYEAIELVEFLSSVFKEEAYATSERLATEKGVAPCFEGTDIHRRNAQLLTCAPTGTISLLANCSGGIEPHFAADWTRTVGADVAGNSIQLHESVPLTANNFVPHTANEIHWQWHLRHQAAWQKHIDNSISKTINMANSATVDDVKQSYITAWNMGCKGITVFRDGCREGVLTSSAIATTELTELDEKLEVVETILTANGYTNSNGRSKLPNERPAVIHKFTVGDLEGYVQVGLYEDGRPAELFITISKEGSTIRGLCDTIGILTSYCLQHGISLDVISSKLQGVSFEPSGFTGNKMIPHASSIIDYIFHWMRHRFIPETLADGHHGTILGLPIVVSEDFNPVPSVNGIKFVNSSGILCPECGGMTAETQGCLMCISKSCGWSRC